MRIFCTSYCNKPHDMDDGKPIEHECYAIPARVLRLEHAGKIEEALAILKKGTYAIHKGKKIVSREEVNFAKGCSILHLATKLDKNGNPRRLYTIVHPDVGIVVSVDEGYSGVESIAVIKACVGAMDILKTVYINLIEITPAEYKAHKTMFKNPAKRWHEVWSQWKPKKK